jgi:(S)-sulfolactate dehydrogenase
MDEAALGDVPERYSVLYDPQLVDEPARLREVAGGARALIVRNRTQVQADLLAALPRLECIGRLGVGLDNIDLEACGERGIAVFPATGMNDTSVAEYVMTAALVLRRGAYYGSGDVASGAWPRQKFIGHEVSGAVLGLVGFGAIARDVARRAQAFGMSVMAFDPYVGGDEAAWQDVRRCSLDDLLACADVISLHTPLTAETQHLIDGDAVSAMKPGAVLINAARGGVVDEDAALAALKAGQLGGLALDVFETEPLDEVAGRRFAGIENLILTPHIAGVTVEANHRISFKTVENVVNALRVKDGG